jgi:DNA mismatch repair ATPase MutS
MALLAHLRSAGGLYLVATHDLTVTSLAGEIPGIRNFHFREEIDGGTMRFDYHLRPGPAPTRNAIRVLEARGYPRGLIEEARERLARIERPGRET